MRELATKWQENGWTHAESAGCRSGLLLEGQYKTEEKLNQVFGGNKGQLEQEKYKMSVSSRRQDSCFSRKMCISSQYQ